MSHIELEGVRVHNLRGFDLRIPHDALTVICGVSGSGKSSLAFDTLFAEGQRRYIETFSPYARQFLNQLERPAVDRVVSVPCAMAIRQQTRLTDNRSTVGTRTEILHDLQLLFAQAGQFWCADCRLPIESWTADKAARDCVQASEGARAHIAFEISADGSASSADARSCSAAGFVRCVLGGRTLRLDDLGEQNLPPGSLIIVDRLRLTRDTTDRISESIRQAFDQSGQCHVLTESSAGSLEIDDASWSDKVYSEEPRCSGCRRAFPEMCQELLSFHSPVGACSSCEGTGVHPELTGAYCESCQGMRLNETGRAIRLADRSLPEVLQLECNETLSWLDEAERTLSKQQQTALQCVFQQIRRRLSCLTDLGLGYLALDRSLMSLSGGEARRVVLVSALGSGLVNSLYVLDEPTSGLHATDIARVIRAIRRLHENGNTVVVVEHDLDVIQSADHIVELGPQAGRAGGSVVLEGSPEVLAHAETATGLALRSQSEYPEDSSSGSSQPDGVGEERSWLTMEDIHCHNIAGACVRIPLNTLCAVTGVSGSGKSSLVVDTLYPAVHAALGNDAIEGSGRCGTVRGADSLREIRLLDQNPLRKSVRSIPATFLGLFDEIRKLLSATHEARKRSYSAGMFSFNSAMGGRCERCQGLGRITIDMQFLADVETVCDNCQGRRFRADVLEVRYRDRSVHEILEMTVEEAFTFFHGVRRLQQSLNALRQAGLGYLALGQPVSTLSGGEAQRLRIAALLAGVPDPECSPVIDGRGQEREGKGILFILDEPSNGLHARDTDQLMQCLRHLVQVGHTVILIEHDARLIRRCDYRIEMGPGAGRHGGQVIFSGAV